jgi:hypothetical protein
MKSHVKSTTTLGEIASSLLLRDEREIAAMGGALAGNFKA